MPHETAATWPRSGSRRSMSRAFIQARQSCSAIQAPVIAAVRVPPSAWITSQSTVICRSFIASSSTTARSERPISRWISSVRPVWRPPDASRRVRSWVARGSMPYSAVIHPRAWPLSHGGSLSSSVAVTSTWVSPNFTKHEPSAYLTTARSRVTARSSSGCRRLGRMTPPGPPSERPGARLLLRARVMSDKSPCQRKTLHYPCRMDNSSAMRELRHLSHDVPIGSAEISLAQLNERSREIFRQIVESYLATGEPVGSRNISRLIPMTLSPASVRNVMSDLEQLGLIYAPHTSAGRLPTELGLRFFVDALMQVGDLTEPERESIQSQLASVGKAQSVEAALGEALTRLSGLTRAAAVVLTAKSNSRLKHIEFVRLEPERALVVLVGEDGQVENRVLTLPPGVPSSALTEATNFLNARIRGRTLAEARLELETALTQSRAELDQLTQKVIAAGLASWSGGENDDRQLIVRGHANLLEDLHALEDLERIRLLFDDLETKRGVIDLLGRAESADGVRIFIGSENKLVSLSGSSTIVAPYSDGAGHIVGVLGVIGPTRLNYARVIPTVDYAARIVSRLLGG